ncbi:hypothetical protein D3C71_1603080 [compost metagenome]
MAPSATVSVPPSRPAPPAPTVNMPACTCVWPVNALPSPVIRNCPKPVLTRPALPAMAPLRPNCVFPATSTTPACVRVIVRPVVKLAVVASVPPLRLRPAAAAPRLASRETDSTPARISVPPLYVLSPVRTSVPWSDFTKVLAPASVAAIVPVMAAPLAVPSPTRMMLSPPAPCRAIASPSIL